MLTIGPYPSYTLLAGLAGLAAACALAVNGHRVRMFEKSPGTPSVAGGIRLPPNAVRILEYLGMQDELSERSVLVTSVALRDRAFPVCLRSTLGAHMVLVPSAHRRARRERGMGPRHVQGQRGRGSLDRRAYPVLPQDVSASELSLASSIAIFVTCYASVLFLPAPMYLSIAQWPASLPHQPTQRPRGLMINGLRSRSTRARSSMPT